MISKQHFSLALVTGASSGIGYAVCHLLAKQKIPLIITGRDLSRLQNLAEELKDAIPINIIAADLSKPEELRSLINEIHKHGPDLVINNAGFGLYGEALSYETLEHLELLNVNGMCVIELTLEAARTLLSNNKAGVILNVSSAAGMLVFPLFASYSASKALVTHFSQSFDYEMAPFGVRILTACPGMVNTSFRFRASHTSNAKSSGVSMSPEYAAEMIWAQIKKQKRVFIFDWKTRLSIFFARVFLPTGFIARIVSNAIKKISPSRSLKL
jgi:uncharacterized protein